MNKSKRTHLRLHELIQKYDEVSYQEAPGILHAIASDLGNELTRTNFLVRIGREDDQKESNEEFRKLARINLVRHVVSKLLVNYEVLSEVMGAAETCVGFFALNSKHAPADNRDLKIVHDFLERFYKAKLAMRETVTDQFTEALVTAKHYEFLIQNGMGEGAVVIYKKLLAQLGGVFPESYKLVTDLKIRRPSMPQDVRLYRRHGRHAMADVVRMNVVAGHILRYPGCQYLRPMAEAMVLLLPFCVSDERAVFEVLL